MNERFGEMLCRIRLQFGFSAIFIARTIGFTRGYICDVEKGNKTPSPNWLIKVAGILNPSTKDIEKLGHLLVSERQKFHFLCAGKTQSEIEFIKDLHGLWCKGEIKKSDIEALLE